MQTHRAQYPGNEDVTFVSKRSAGVRLERPHAGMARCLLLLLCIVLAQTTWRGAQALAQVSLTASPNPITVACGATLGQTTISWNAPGHSSIEVLIPASNNAAFVPPSPSSGSSQTGVWVPNGLEFDLVDASTGAILQRLTVAVQQQECVSTPTVPSGSTNVVMGVQSSYSTGGATDSAGNGVQYQFSWGDGASSSWQSTTSASHAWSTAGTYSVTVQARSATTPSVVSTVSGALRVNVSAPAGSITQLIPPSKVVGSSSFTLTVNGASFSSDAKVCWNGNQLPTTWNSATTLTATVSADLVAAISTASITVTESTGISQPVIFPVTGIASGTPLALSRFKDCISTSGVGLGYTDGTSPYVCQLQSGLHSISQQTGGTIIVGRSNITIQGTMTTSPADTTLQRGDTSTYYIMQLASGVSNVTIRNLQFDGNRCPLWSPGLTSPCTGQWPSACHPPYSVPPNTYIDLEAENLPQGGSSYITVSHVDFVNSPQQSLTPAPHSIVEYCNFTQPANTGVVTWPTAADQTITGLTIQNNTFIRNGGSAIALQYVINSIIKNNNMYSSNNEGPDKGAAALGFDEDSTNNYALLNLIDGQNDQDSCVGAAPFSGIQPKGIETWGSNIHIQGNTIINNPSGGVVASGDHVYFEPEPISHTQNIISNNGWDGVHIGNYTDARKPSGYVAASNMVFTNNVIANNCGAAIDLQYNNIAGISNVSIDGATLSQMTGNAYGSVVAACGSGSGCPATDTTFVVPNPLPSSCPPAPTITNISPNSIAAGAGVVSVTITGTNFTGSGGSVTWNTTSLPPTYVSPTVFTISVPANLTAVAGPVSVKVSTSGGTSAALPVTITP